MLYNQASDYRPDNEEPNDGDRIPMKCKKQSRGRALSADGFGPFVWAGVFLVCNVVPWMWPG